MKTVALMFRGGVFPPAQLEIAAGPTKPYIIVPTPGGFGGSGYAMIHFRFRWLEWNDESKMDVYLFDGIAP